MKRVLAGICVVGLSLFSGCAQLRQVTVNVTVVPTINLPR
jgi:hypothetical protein